MRRMPIKRQGALCEDKAWLLGFMAGDGNVSVAPDGSAQISANCGSADGDEQLARHVAGLFEKLYDVPATVRLQGRPEGRTPYWQPIVYRRAVAEDLLGFGPLGTYDWRVPRRIEGSPRLSAAWASGFFDAEAHVRVDPSRSARSISAASVNAVGLRRVSVLLDRIGIRTAWHSEASPRGEGWSPGHTLIVCNRRSVERFAELVGFRCERKKELLDRALSSYRRDHPNLLRSEVEAALPEVLRRRAAGEAFEEIAEAMSLATVEVPKGMVKRASKKAGGRCLLCFEAEATHSVPRVVRGRPARYVCEPCLDGLEPAPEWTDELVQLKVSKVADLLDQHHYLGRRSGRRAFALRNQDGALVFSRSPQAASLPREWLELSRWCLTSSGANAGSRQWGRARRWLLENTEATTVVSYSDPSRHDGALYRASGWLWAPSGQYILKGLSLARERHPSAPYVDKNRWVYPLRPDPERQGALAVRHPWLWSNQDLRFLCDWPEPRWKRGRFSGGGKDYKRWRRLLASRA